uniref:Protein kinase domain-containing protein n=1 Tax=Caenorhabditis tropicalis TaxID=1561998 RepID=A0A1I7TLL1_9PELO
MVGPGLALDARFVLVKNVSRGSYGVVWSARDLITNQVVAIKLVPKFQESEKDETFVTEVESLQALRGVVGVPEFISSGSIGQHNYFATQVFDFDLEDIRFKHRGYKFRLTSILQTVYHVVKIIEIVHSRGIVHRDVKLNNIMRYNLVLIDFGLAAKFRDPTTGNRIPVPHAGLDFLSVPYSPPRAAAGSEYLETEDLVSAAIVAVYMAFESPSSVPWYAQNALAMQRKKLHFGKYPEIYLPNHRCVAPVIKIINSQEYGATPDYQSILTFIQHTLGEMNCSTELNLHL